MKFVDVHVHPGFSSPLFQKVAQDNKIDYSLRGLLREMKKGEIEKAVAIGWTLETNEEIAQIAETHKQFVPVFGIRIKEIGKYADVAEKEMKAGRYEGFKIFLGYEPVYPNDGIFAPIYRLAEKYDVPVIFHTGDTWSGMNNRARVKFAHPLAIDELAVEHPDMKILIAHAGNPWVQDTAEVIYKNENCFADISGWFLGTVEGGYAKLMRDNLEFLIEYAGSDKLMFGSDWPLIKIDKYADFLRKSGLGQQYLENIAHKTAESFWGL